jgi:hypothetical protein
VTISLSRALLDKDLLLHRIEVPLRKSLSPKLKSIRSMLLRNPFLRKRRKMVPSSWLPRQIPTKILRLCRRFLLNLKISLAKVLHKALMLGVPINQ